MLWVFRGIKQQDLRGGKKQGKKIQLGVYFSAPMLYAKQKWGNGRMILKKWILHSKKWHSEDQMTSKTEKRTDG